MSKIILTRGIPASGKSTWAKAWVAEDPEHRFRVNRDNLRWTLGIKSGVGTRAQEEQVTYWQHRMAEYALQCGQDVVVDDTNLRAKYVKEWLRLAKAMNAEVEFQDFPITFDEANRRDMQRRENGERWVGDVVIYDFYTRFTPKGVLPAVPTLGDEQVKLHFPLYQPPAERYADHAIIVDIDGTLAHMTGRSPYDPTLYHTDTFDELVGSLASMWAYNTGAKIIVVTGRDGDHEAVTREWLFDNLFTYDEFYMRPAGDTRNDAIVKNEIFEKHIAGRFHIDFVLDDRDRVVRMWRAKGLKVLQVADGNF